MRWLDSLTVAGAAPELLVYLLKYATHRLPVSIRGEEAAVDHLEARAV
jgi:hypothetical protein